MPQKKTKLRCIGDFIIQLDNAYYYSCEGLVKVAKNKKALGRHKIIDLKFRRVIEGVITKNTKKIQKKAIIKINIVKLRIKKL